jgi:Na+/H+ antiporter NhaD and related arsenite permeases
MGMLIYYLMPIIFLTGVLAIALEDVIKINKAATAVGMCVLLWFLYLIGVQDFNSVPFKGQTYETIENLLINSLGNVSTTLFFVLASMAIIEEVDEFGGFDIITNSIKVNKGRKLLWIICLITFFVSALFGDIAAVIIMIAIARKLIPDNGKRLLFSCMIIIAANAGGCCSPIGDVTTLLLWTNKNFLAAHQISTLILPAFTMLLIPLIFTTFAIPKDEVYNKHTTNKEEAYLKISPKLRQIVFIIGIASLALVPLLQSLFNLPPFMGVLLGLVILWGITDRKFFSSKDKDLSNLKVCRVFKQLDISTIFFFLGILMSVQALNGAGQLNYLANALHKIFSNSNDIAVIFGICSSFLDNVALVSATMGMFPIEQAGDFATNGNFWTLLSYCAVTGGSILIIGSASGVTAMGLEKISFGYYLKRFTFYVLGGFFAGIAVFWLLT